MKLCLHSSFKKQTGKSNFISGASRLVSLFEMPLLPRLGRHINYDSCSNCGTVEQDLGARLAWALASTLVTSPWGSIDFPSFRVKFVCQNLGKTVKSVAN